MYYVYIGKMLLPIAPTEIETSIGSNNKTYDLINEGEVTVIKSAPLQEIKFDFILPVHQYAFAHYKSGFIGASVFLEYMSTIKEDREPIQLIITRMNGTLGAVVGTTASVLGSVLGATGSIGNFTNLKVTLEDYAISESAENGMDYKISATFREYREPKLFELSSLVKTGASVVAGALAGITTSSKIATTTTVRSTTTSPEPKKTAKTYTVKKGDTLWAIAKKYYGDGSKYQKIADANSIKNPDLIKIGQKLTIPVVK